MLKCLPLLQLLRLLYLGILQIIRYIIKTVRFIRTKYSIHNYCQHLTYNQAAHSLLFQNSPADLPDTSLNCGDDSVFLPSSPTSKTSSDPLQQTTAAFAHLSIPGSEVHSAPGRLVVSTWLVIQREIEISPHSQSISNNQCSFAGRQSLHHCATLPMKNPRQQRLFWINKQIK